VADRFALGIDRIEHAAAHARELARARGLEQPEADDLFAAARALSLDGGTDVVRPVRQPFGWHDLVVPTETRQRLQDLLHAVELRPEVFDRWQFRRPCGGQRGILAMFAGASGTGKTMAAAIIARELGMELHRVELAAVMSKYIGETEKNLDRAFAAARRANAILFVDEADALLGKRSEVRDAHDRYANVEIAFLLQRMEDHDGVVIVATNLANNIDAAFSRRMHFVVQFQLPDGASRERLWQQMLPPEAPRGADLDIGYLARQFEFSGGDIRNIALDAAFHAARTRAPIGMRAVLTAVITHYAKRGRLPHANEFGPYAGLLRAAVKPELSAGR
jgi:SpoVK/Ycf46/Vps4 family AAA+-type ATPase